MTHLLFVFLCLVQLVSGSSTNATGSSCPAPDGNTRTVWSILGSCALTLLICVWHALHPGVPKLGRRWHMIWLKRVGFVVLSFFAPEVVVARASGEWCKAHRQIKKFRQKGYEWSMAHSHFARMHGFVYRNEQGRTTTIDADEFLQFCKEGKIGNPLITEKEIKGLGKSDGIGKAIFTVQLFWFILQVVARGSNGLAITLVELDTVCMAVLAVVYLFFWWDKPLRPDCPYVFWYSGDNRVYSQKELSDAWESESSCWDRRTCRDTAYLVADQENTPEEETDFPDFFQLGKLTPITEDTEAVVYMSSLFITWLILGALHLVAWNFEFATETERTTWRVASLVLTGTSPALFVLAFLIDVPFIDDVAMVLVPFVGVSGIITRVLLVGLMLASLRALPCSAYEIVPWTAYIPHL